MAAYAVCVHDGRLLLAQLSHRTGSPGAWTLPGGGIDHGEEPRAAVVREVQEETGLVVELGALLDVDSVHFTGHSPYGMLEDYHSVRLLFAGQVADRRAAGAGARRQHDGGGWLPLDAVARRGAGRPGAAGPGLAAHAAPTASDERGARGWSPSCRRGFGSRLDRPFQARLTRWAATSCFFGLRTRPTTAR